MSAPDATWDNLVMTMRIGDRPRIVVTTTPRPTPLMRRILALPSMTETRGRTGDNPHLPDSFVAAMRDAYGGTLIGRQELDGELIEEVAGALWTRAMLEDCRAADGRGDDGRGIGGRMGDGPEMVRTVVGVDPPAGIGGDACGIVAVALGHDGCGR